MANLMRYIPKEYKRLVVNIYDGKKVWNDVTNRWNTTVIVEWQNGETSEFQNKTFMTAVLREFHTPDEYAEEV